MRAIIRRREQRRLTQLDLALDAGSSARHVSFLETGRTVPSKDMVATLARVLDVPLRERNLLFLTAGFAPPYRETGLDDARMFSTVTTLSTPQDVTLQDLHIEAFYPADAETAALTFYR